MLISFVERWHHPDKRAVDRYTRWRNVLAQWRSACDVSGDQHPLASASALIEGLSEVDQAGALQDMLAWSLWASWQHGRGMLLDDFRDECETHPIARDWAANPPLDLVEDEFLARHQQPHGDSPRIDEFAKRFPQRADVCAALEKRLVGGGRYVRLSMLGGGAMGEVWEAWDSHSRRLVALKQLARDAEPALQAREALAREFRMAARLHHSGIIQMLDYHDESCPFFTMSLIRGDTFAARIRDVHQPPPDCTRKEREERWRELAETFVRICDAVAAAHEQGVIHRDLKPANVLVGTGGEVAVSDWALAKDVHERDTLTEGARVVGTPEYMAPEQADGRADARSDVFGLGAILYEMLTVRPPRDAASLGASSSWQQSLREQPILSPRGLSSHASKRLAAMCMKALSAEPRNRHASAAEFAAEARRYFDDQRRGWLARIFQNKRSR